MTHTALVDGVRLTLRAGGWVWKYDDSSFHRGQFQGFAGGSKAVDAIVLLDETLWLIELKDFRRSRRSKPSTVFFEVAAKVKATLAGLAVARVRANDSEDRRRAKAAMSCRSIRVVLQLAQPVKPSRLFPKVVDPGDASIKLRRELRAVDAHPVCLIGDIDSTRLPWTTTYENAS